MIDKKRGFPKMVLDIVNPYAWVTGLRNKAFDLGMLKSEMFGIPVICIGNITVGGTGKTPHTEYLIRLLKNRSRTAVLSRGYGRCSKGYIKSDTVSTMQQIGDEPFQIKNKFKGIDVAVCEKRIVGIERLLSESKPPEVILLDDAYQHRHVKAGLNILLIDSHRPIWQDCILPFGRMRESLLGLKRADVIIITKCQGVSDGQKKWCKEYLRKKKEVPVFFSAVRYGAPYRLFDEREDVKVPLSANTKVLLVTGIAKPDPLRSEIENRGARTELLRYADHHNFSDKDIIEIAERFRLMDGDKKIILTTEKDATRLLTRTDIPSEIRDKIYVLPIEIEILDGEEKMFNQIILDYVTENSGNRRIP